MCYKDFYLFFPEQFILLELPVKRNSLTDIHCYVQGPNTVVQVWSLNALLCLLQSIYFDMEWLVQWIYFSRAVFINGYCEYVRFSQEASFHVG